MTPRTPQDRKKPSSDGTGPFVFTFRGKDYTTAPISEVVTPGFLRANRRRDQVDQVFTLFEALLSEKDLEATIDVMTREEFNAVGDELRDFMETSLGE